jgi:hypothetical protein
VISELKEAKNKCLTLAKENAELQATEKRLDRELMETKGKLSAQTEKSKRELKELNDRIHDLQRQSTDSNVQQQLAQQRLVTEKELEIANLKKEFAKLKGKSEALEAELQKKDGLVKEYQLADEKLKAGDRAKAGAVDSLSVQLKQEEAKVRYLRSRIPAGRRKKSWRHSGPS